MLPLAHTYISSKATNRIDALLIFGSVLPDIATSSAQQIGSDKIHNDPRSFSEFVNAKYPELTDLALGVRLHSQVDGGADFYSDNTETGYAKLNGAQLSTDVADLLGVPDGELSFVLAHNFIELAIDLHIYKNHREIWNIYNETIKQIRAEFPKIAKCLAEYLDLKTEYVQTELENLVDLLSPENLASKELAIKNSSVKFIELRLHKTVSAEKALAITDKAIAVAEPTYLEFLNSTVVAVKNNILTSR